MGQRESVECDVIRLTNGPKHHLFGFHDLQISNYADSKYLCVEVGTINRPPLPGEVFGVGYVENGRFIKLGDTVAFNYPQGARQQWLAQSDMFTVNNRIGDDWGTELYDASSNCLLDRFENPTHMLSKDGRYAYGLDYSRLYRLGGYGYAGIADKYSDNPIPSGSGITKTDLLSKECQLLVSVKDVAGIGNNGRIPGVSHHYLTHLCLNPSSTRIAFLHRYFLGDGGMMTRLMTIGTDGTGLRCLAQGFLSHYDWKDDDHIYIFGRANSALDSLRNNPLLSNPVIVPILKSAKRIVKKLLNKERGSLVHVMSFLMIEDREGPEINPFAKGVIVSDGHPMTSPSCRDWFVCDTYPDEEKTRDLFLYCFPNDSRYDIGRFRMIDEKPDLSLSDLFLDGVDKVILDGITVESLAFTRSGLHCDLHPRWNSTGKRVFFDSIHEGTRQIYMADVEHIIMQ